MRRKQKEKKAKQIPILSEESNENYQIQSLSLPTEIDKKNVKKEIDDVIYIHIQNKIYSYLKWWGFRNSPPLIICIVLGSLLLDLFLDAWTLENSEYCLYLNICVFLLQLESLVLYACAFCSVTNDFIEKVVSQLAHIDIDSNEYKSIVDEYVLGYQNEDDARRHSKTAINSPKTSLTFDRLQSKHRETSALIYESYKSKNTKTGIKILMNEAIKCLLVILPSYLSGYFIFFTIGSGSELWHYYVYTSNVLDFLRYAPQILHIALARSYFQTFPIQLDRLRESLNVIARGAEFDKFDFVDGKHLLTVTHSEFIEACEIVIRPYRRLSGQLSQWIAIYFVCNAASFTMFLLSIVSALTKTGCESNDNERVSLGLYYVHYLVELWTFFAGWCYLVMPYCSNDTELDYFFNDVRTMGNVSGIEKCAIDAYIDSYNQRSPFSIYSIKPSYAKFMRWLYLVLATITLDAVVRFNNINDDLNTL